MRREVLQMLKGVYTAPPESCLCASCCIARGERTREAFDACEKPDYSPLLSPSFWVRGASAKKEPAPVAAE